jgi:hypothetical protein
MKKATALLGAIVLSAAAAPALAQQSYFDDDSAEGRPHLNLGPAREVTQACRAEAKQQGLAGKERRRFVTACQNREAQQSSGASGASGMSGMSGMSSMSGTTNSRTLSPMRDADGRYPPEDVTTSRFSQGDPSRASAKPTIPNLDAEGRPRPQ